MDEIELELLKNSLNVNEELLKEKNELLQDHLRDLVGLGFILLVIIFNDIFNFVKEYNAQ